MTSDVIFAGVVERELATVHHSGRIREPVYFVMVEIE
jgi:hypothetical protein